MFWLVAPSSGSRVGSASKYVIIVVVFVVLVLLIILIVMRYIRRVFVFIQNPKSEESFFFFFSWCAKLCLFSWLCLLRCFLSSCSPGPSHVTSKRKGAVWDCFMVAGVYFQIKCISSSVCLVLFLFLSWCSKTTDHFKVQNKDKTQKMSIIPNIGKSTECFLWSMFSVACWNIFFVFFLNFKLHQLKNPDFLMVAPILSTIPSPLSSHSFLT